MESKFEVYQKIKKHLEEYLTTIVKKMQDVTN